MQADLFILAAGFGTRLGDLTKDTPKPLIEVAGKAVIEYNLELVQREGFKKVFINLHYLSDKIRNHVGDGSKWGLEISYVKEEAILGTGGAIRNIEPLLEHDVLVTMNSDTIFGDDFSLRKLIEAHLNQPMRPLATLVLRENLNPALYGEIGIDKSGRVRSMLGRNYFDASPVEGLMYLGVQAISRTLFSYMPLPGAKFSITRDVYARVLEKGGVIGSLRYNGYFADIGSFESLKEASKEVGKNKKGILKTD